MNHTENVTRYVGNFVDELFRSGLTHAVISPGSRSTPLAMMLCEHKKIKEYVVIDERSAAFFALGIAKKTKKPVAIVCTSGTAAANYMPAIVEARYARVPLIVLTADRPHELRHIGASQTINQVGMYGDFVKIFEEMALPEGSDMMLNYVRQRAGRAYRIAEGPVAGPVHLNFPFREPLVPDFSLDNIWGKRKERFNLLHTGKKRLEPTQLMQLAKVMQEKERGLIVCGPQFDMTLADAVIALSEQLNIPILADPLSQLRAGAHEKDTVITTYDAVLRTEKIRAEFQPDYMIRFGAMPISKNFMFYSTEHRRVPQFVVEEGEEVREPTNDDTQYIIANSVRFCEDMMHYIEAKEDRTWLHKWQVTEQIAKDFLQAEDKTLTEGITARTLATCVPNNSILFTANSMPVRDIDTFFFQTDKNIIVQANRGVSGIDGTIATALGMAAVTKKRVTLFIGDLSFYHDLNSLWMAKHYNIDITIVVINNNGGGIFSFLPQSKEEKHFETLFGTPLHIDFSYAVNMYEGIYSIVEDVDAFIQQYEQSLQMNGLSVIEVQTDRAENVAWHRDIWGKIVQKVEQYVQ